MREILFRGKRYDGVWMEGGLFMHDPVRVCFSNEKEPAEPMIITDGFCDWGFEPPMLAAKVIPETVGQFTGLTDKNGKKVFENDIIVICYETDGEEFSEIKRVHYNEKKCCWYPMRWEECCEHCDHYTEVKSIEVIGNIHDNPELLEV